MALCQLPEGGTVQPWSLHGALQLHSEALELALVL
jgi:hypothetical protein